MRIRIEYEIEAPDTFDLWQLMEDVDFLKSITRPAEALGSIESFLICTKPEDCKHGHAS